MVDREQGIQVGQIIQASIEGRRGRFDLKVQNVEQGSVTVRPFFNERLRLKVAPETILKGETADGERLGEVRFFPRGNRLQSELS